MIKPTIYELGQPATFGVKTDLPEPYKYNWIRNGQLIPGAPSAPCYATQPLNPDILTDKISVIVYGRMPQGAVAETSEEVQLREFPNPKSELEVYEESH